VARRWRDPNAFRADPADAAARPTRRQSAALLIILVLIAGVIATVSYVVRPERARSFDLFGGSIFLADQVAPVAVDLATGSPSLRLRDATAQVGLKRQQSSDLAVVPLDAGGGTLLLNRTTGEFNMVDATGFVIKPTGGVAVDRQTAPNAKAVGLSAQDSAAPDLAYIEESSPQGTQVYLVSQATVRAKSHEPRAIGAIGVPVSTEPGASASADGHLWTLAGRRGQRRSLMEFSLPRNSDANGAALSPDPHGTVSAQAAIGSAAVGPNAQQSVVGVADAHRIRVFSPHAHPPLPQYTVPGGVHRVLAATNQTGRLAFLLQGAKGWYLVSVGINGTDLHRPTRIPNLPPNADLAPPAASGDALYTLDRRSGRIWQIRPGAPAADMASYPLAQRNGKSIEPGAWGDTYVIARDDRVFYDSPSHEYALALFTDPHTAVRSLVIQKSKAVNLPAVADPTWLSRSRNQPPPPPPAPAPPPRRVPPPPPNWKVGNSQPPQHPGGQQTINNSIACQTAAQKLNTPQILAGWQAASTSVTLSWAYPPIANQDCIPRTYEVSATPIAGADPRTRVVWRVNNAQTSAILTHLYPSSRYRFTVTAFLGSLSTSSTPVTISTTAEGPNPPTNVQVQFAKGGWNLRWDSCGTAAPNCIPSSSWQIQPTVCNGQSSLGALRPKVVPGDPTTRQQPPAVYPGSTALLGRGLSFQITGTGVNNLVGTPSPATPCKYSWAPPIASALKLAASTPSETAFGTTTTANATLNLGADPIRDVGGVDATVTFRLLGNGATQTSRPIVVNGSRSTISTTFHGVTPGVQYTATASVQPPHGGSPISLSAGPLKTRSAWPNYAIDPTCAQAVLSCNLQVNFAGISSANSRGESFSLTNASEVRCNNTAQPLNDTGFDPGTSPVTATLSQLGGFYGTCQVTIQLVEDTRAGQPVYGGIPSPLRTRTVHLGPPPHANVGRGDFDVTWDPQSTATVQVMYTGTEDLTHLTTNWSETVTAPGGGQQCGSAQGQPGSAAASAVLIAVDPSCVNLYGAEQAPWTVTVQFANRSDGSSGGPFTYSVPGPPPVYQACAPQGLLAASWGRTQADPVSVTVPPNAPITGCSQWSYVLYDGSTPPNQICPAVTGPPPVNIYPTQCGTPPGNGWFVRASWVDTAGQPQQEDLRLGPPPPS
jgi:hypothetical protein